MARAVELTILWGNQKAGDAQWRKLTTTNPLHQAFNKISKGLDLPDNPVAKAINVKRDEEFTSRRAKFKTIRCLRPQRMVDPILYLAATSKDRHRLVKWRMHWLPSYPLKECECGTPAATREHYGTCPSLHLLREELLNAYGAVPTLPNEQQPLDHIMNHLPRSDVGLTRGKWRKVWPALLHVLRKIDKLSHKDADYDEDEPDPGDALQGNASTTMEERV